MFFYELCPVDNKAYFLEEGGEGEQQRCTTINALLLKWSLPEHAQRYRG